MRQPSKLPPHLPHSTTNSSPGRQNVGNSMQDHNTLHAELFIHFLFAFFVCFFCLLRGAIYVYDGTILVQAHTFFNCHSAQRHGAISVVLHFGAISIFRSFVRKYLRYY